MKAIIRMSLLMVFVVVVAAVTGANQQLLKVLAHILQISRIATPPARH